MNVLPFDDGNAVSRLLDHCSDPGRLGPAKPSAQERLELVLGAEFARQLVAALSGDHRLPPRAFRGFRTWSPP